MSNLDRLKAVLDEASTAEIESMYAEMLKLLNECRHTPQEIIFTDATGRLGQLVGCRVTDHAGQITIIPVFQFVKTQGGSEGDEKLLP